MIAPDCLRTFSSDGMSTRAWLTLLLLLLPPLVATQIAAAAGCPTWIPSCFCAKEQRSLLQSENDPPSCFRRAHRFLQSRSPVNWLLFFPPPHDPLFTEQHALTHVALRSVDSYDTWWKHVHESEEPSPSSPRTAVIYDRGHKHDFDYVLVYFNGNAMDLDASTPFVNMLGLAWEEDVSQHSAHSGWSVEPAQRLRLRLLNVEYPGYGWSRAEGPPSEAGILKHARAVVAWLLREEQVPPSKLVLAGYSMGAGAAIDLAHGVTKYALGNPRLRHAGETLGALILFAPFTSIRSVARRHVSHLAYLIAQRFDNLSKIRSVMAPTLYIHGTHDRVVPAWHSQELSHAQAEAREKRVLWMQGVGHRPLLSYETAHLVYQFLLHLKDGYSFPDNRSAMEAHDGDGGAA